MKILIMSCDNNRDLWEPFHYFWEKYWPDHPETIYLTDTLDNPYYTTIKKNYPIGKWTRRVRDAASEIDDEKILIMCDDIFIYDTPNTKLLEQLSDVVKEGTGSLNLHHWISPKEQKINEYIQARPKGAQYNCSVMCSMWYKPSLLRVFDCDKDPWEFERTAKDLGLNYYIWGSPDDFFKFREPNVSYLFGVRLGKWTKHCIDLFNREGIAIDVNSRGIYNGR